MQNLVMQKASIEDGLYAEPLGSASTSLIDVHDMAAVAEYAALPASPPMPKTLEPI
jgi:hypothetical protein